MRKIITIEHLTWGAQRDGQYLDNLVVDGDDVYILDELDEYIQENHEGED